MLVARCWLLFDAVCRVSCVVRCLSFVVRCLLFVVRRLVLCGVCSCVSCVLFDCCCVFVVNVVVCSCVCCLLCVICC